MVEGNSLNVAFQNNCWDSVAGVVEAGMYLTLPFSGFWAAGKWSCFSFHLDTVKDEASDWVNQITSEKQSGQLWHLNFIWRYTGF